MIATAKRALRANKGDEKLHGMSECMLGVHFGVQRAASARDWVQAHEALSQLAKSRALADAEEGRCLLAAHRAAAHVHLGFGTFSEYIERLFGYKPRSTYEKLRVAEALENLPVLARALEHGELNWSAVRELTRVAVPDTEQEWLDVARGKTIHQLEALVAGTSPGDTPAASNRSPAPRHVLRFDVTSDTLALWREAIEKLRRDSGTRLDDDSALMLMARHVLGGPVDEGRASYQIALSVCAHCRAGFQHSHGELVPVDAEIVEMAHCDSQHLGLVAAHRVDKPDAHRARAETASDADCASDADDASDADCASDVHAHAGAVARTGTVAHAHGGTVADAGAHAGRDASTRVDVGSDAHAGADAHAHAHAGRDAHTMARGGGTPTRGGRTRARQAVSKATRRAVLHRDHRCCTVPGCRNARFVDVHHLKLRSERGNNGADNLITLCGVHHRAVHDGELVVEGNPKTGVRFAHADGAEYGRVTNPRRAEARTNAFAALQNLGFREGQIAACARHALAPR